MVVGSYADTTFQELHTTFNVTFVRMRVSGVVWSKWERQATATPPAVYDLPLSAGYIAVDDEPTAYRKTQNERCHVYAEVQKSDGSYWVEGSVFASLPEGFRPPCHVVRPCFFSSGGSPNGYGHLHIYHDGRMVVQAVSVNTNTVFFDIGFWSA